MGVLAELEKIPGRLFLKAFPGSGNCRTGLFFRGSFAKTAGGSHLLEKS
jgi:hypothetical protein